MNYEQFLITKPASLPFDPQTGAEFRGFVQAMLNRMVVGELRYGVPATRKRYMSRMGRELQEYRKTGNAEHLFNIDNYALLESIAPEHQNQHWDMAAELATRAEFGGER